MVVMTVGVMVVMIVMIMMMINILIAIMTTFIYRNNKNGDGNNIKTKAHM